ncbi:OPT oligopeptide transporter protein-domain-containing protein [Yarrowia lipolytica]|nr:OPT oligopeptide transporter protein-domain-containing protein [Yarrowia lipolytica]KAE8174948.1 OPT oligopeptide transporter protein-domain-containing protein [Yarrowia lipolytica]RDW37033.1 OPT oligopeptide transporter protein-domain-containing protein [Yarrowia lipolytica]RDW46772.1 OPT oligopeptide transporter protein-domain-containing protein [Yarrowia lipolytica]RDW55064.1 OPT oligopeptide transporter protein-domain-containing protein [Yarrowia lipolytica]
MTILSATVEKAKKAKEIWLQDDPRDQDDDDSQVQAEVVEVDDSLIEWIAMKLGIPPSDFDGSYPREVHFMAEKLAEMTLEKALNIVKVNFEYHDHDNNFRHEYRVEINGLKEAFGSGEDPEKEDPENILLVRYWATIFHWWSPYPEVRSVTDPYDETETTVETWRVWVLGTIWVAIAAFVNQFFSVRLPAISLGSGYTLPDWGFTFRGKRYTLNPGVWSQKEQLLATIMIGCAAGTPYVTSNIITQALPSFYNQDWARGFGYQFVLTLVTQMMGFGLAGLLKRVAVYPVKAMWPSLLPTLAVNKALLAPNRKESINGWKISRYTFFMIIFAFSFLYFWVPNYLMNFLQTFNWMTWIAPGNKDLAVVTGSVAGLGFNPIPTFDWNQAVAGIAPITLPLYTSVTGFVGTFFGGLVILAVYYTNNSWTAHIPINSNRLFDNKGKSFNVTRILTDYKFDKEKFLNYSTPYYSAGNLVLYSAFFSIYTFSFVYTILMDWRAMRDAIVETAKALRYIHRSNYHGRVDPFSRYMRRHKEVPDWWFYLTLLIMFVLAIVLVEVWPVDTPVWSIVFVMGLVAVFIIPFTVFVSYTATSLSLNVLSELIIGYALPGRFMALNLIKALSVQIAEQAENYTSDQKLTHYAHLPPRSIFWLQIWATLVNIFVCLGVIQFQLGLDKICDADNRLKFTCPSETTFFTASIAWGVIGPKKMFDKYPVMKWMFLFGACAGLFFWFVQVMVPYYMAKKWPKYSEKIHYYRRKCLYFNPLIFVVGMLAWAPQNLTYKVGGLYLAILFNGYIKSRYLSWWRKYAYVLEAAMDTGIALSGIIIFFSVQYHPKDLEWWGNDVIYDGMDGGGIPLPPHVPIPEDPGYFGPPPSQCIMSLVSALSLIVPGIDVIKSTLGPELGSSKNGLVSFTETVDVSVERWFAERTNMFLPSKEIKNPDDSFIVWI